jgi:hypothetical protein
MLIEIAEVGMILETLEQAGIICGLLGFATMEVQEIKGL